MSRFHPAAPMTAPERLALGLLLAALLAAFSAAAVGATRVRAASPSPAPTESAAHAGPEVALVMAQGPFPADMSGTAPEHCDALRAEGLRVTLTDAESAAYCVVEEPKLGATYVQLLNVPDPRIVPERKVQTARALATAGLDVCTVTLWWVRRDAVRARVPVTEQYASPAECAPRIISHDPVAAQWQDFTARTVADALAQAERQYGVRPSMPLTIHLHGTPEGYVRHVTAHQPDDAIRARLAETEGITARGTIDGVWIVLDASRFSPRWPERAAFTIRHEIAHYLQTVIAGCACAYPLWFAEGMADYSAVHALGPITTRHLAARNAERMGKATPLREMESATAAGVPGLYDRGYATVAYLAERWGAETPGELLRRNRNGDPATFTMALADLTGMSLDELDHAVGRWLLAATPEGAATGGMRPRFAAAYAVYDPAAGQVEGEGSVFGPAHRQIDVVVAWDCASGAHRITVRWYRPDGTMAHTEQAGGAEMRCAAITRSRLALSPAVLATPGRWRVEFVADGQPTISMAITINDA